MAFRRPAAQRRRVPAWRRSGGEICWEEEPLPQVSHPSARPQSAIEEGQLDTWLEYLQGKARPLIRNPSFTDLDKEPARRRSSHPSFSTGSSSCGSSSVCESPPSSQDSLRTGFLPPAERRGSWEKAHIMRPPKKEQAQLSYLAPVKIGWLPIQRRVMMAANACSQKGSDNSAGQVKLREPITPTFKRNEETSQVQDAAAGRGHTGPSSLGVKMWWTPDRGSAVSKEVPDKLRFPVEDGGRRVGWEALRAGWKANRGPAFPGGHKSNELTTETGSDPNKAPPPIKTTRTEPPERSPLHRTASADPSGQRTLLQGTSAADTHKSHTPLQRTSGVQPMKATAFYGPSSSLESSQANSTLTTYIPQNKAGISSITITSRKVSRSASLPGSNSSSNSPSPPLDHQPMDPNATQVRVQRKAMIVKVTEKRVISSTGSSTSRPGTPPASHALDTVVRRRKATIIKVTEHRESYHPPKIATRNPEYRHSYTEGLYQDNSTWNQKNGSEENTALPYHRLNPFTPNSNTYGRHKSTLNLFVSNPPATTSASSEVSTRAGRQRSDRLQRPLSCYGSLTGCAEASAEDAAQPAARKWSLGLPRESRVDPVNFDGGFISPGKAAKEAGRPAADALNDKERGPPSAAGMRRASPSLTLIQAPDPHQSQEEVLALNAAAIIANIKLQRQLSKKKTPSSDPGKDAAASPRGHAVMDERKCIKSSCEQSKAHRQKQPGAEFVSLGLDPERSPETVSLQRAAASPRRGTGLKNQYGSPADVQTGLHQPLPEQSARAGTEVSGEEGQEGEEVGFGGWTARRRSQAEEGPRHKVHLCEW
ncbi:(E2-independent) E3 ubiquitin-conjugating enzyme FATS isoform X2 [Kryptolebias marmoratus]|uniref:(E2-independent) E3 ubiquitin-conjugating enzyme FATS isoform X2 n=1 Tax=Kryptolebias marmoratus TaxID=37003 RepID=UPI000D52F9DD|nr:(E2-independent) E3 ubiquitin-conjugating enzyme FATS isoform X2 [Kryptolebias marmoratus]